MRENGRIEDFNSNYRLLRYVTRLLRDLGVEVTRPHLHHKSGTPIKHPEKGKSHIRGKNVYTVYVKRRSVWRFSVRVGFTILRKLRRLEGFVRTMRERGRPFSSY